VGDHRGYIYGDWDVDKRKMPAQIMECAETVSDKGMFYTFQQFFTCLQDIGQLRQRPYGLSTARGRYPSGYAFMTFQKRMELTYRKASQILRKL
jgi:hypothetical protein